MTDRTLLNINLTSDGYSEDHMLDMLIKSGSRMALVRDSTKLVATCADPRVNITTIYRQVGDDPPANPLNQDPVQFAQSRLNAAPQAHYVHLTNEVGYSDFRDRWTDTAAKVVKDAGKIPVCINSYTNTSLAIWRQSEAYLRKWIAAGYAIGFHYYRGMKPNPGGTEFIKMKEWLGGEWLGTEYAYAHADVYPDGSYIISETYGYRGDFSPRTLYNDWLNEDLQFWWKQGTPLFVFSGDQWRNNPEGRARGFGLEDEPDIYRYFSTLNFKYGLEDSMVIPDPIANGRGGTITQMPGDYVNLRSQPNGIDVGDAHKGDHGIYYPNEVQQGWMFFRRDDGAKGWISLQNGTVVFTADGTPVPPKEVNTVSPEVYADLVALDGALDEAKGLVQKVLKAVKPSSEGGF